MDCFVRKIEASDISEITKIHLDAFPDFFLSFLGARFLKEFYMSFINENNSIGFVAQRIDKELLGVIVGPLNPNDFFKKLLKRRWWAFCIAGIKAVLKKPSCILKLIRAIFYRGDSPTGQTRALLSSIAVKKKVQGKGVGKTLVQRWLQEAYKRGAYGCLLTTDSFENEGVNRFYQNLGWRIDSTYSSSNGRKMNRYIFDF
jgi:GNAT superfamily N-acetyltransferase